MVAFLTGMVTSTMLLYKEPEEIQTIQIPEPEVIHEIEVVEIPKIETVEILRIVARVPETEITEEEKRMIAGVVWHEAGNQDMIGKRLVVDCILNRMDDADFPSTIKSVIYQPNQFCVPSTYYDEDCMAAVEYELFERLDYEVKYFRTGEYHSFGTPLYVHGAHYFSK